MDKHPRGAGILPSIEPEGKKFLFHKIFMALTYLVQGLFILCGTMEMVQKRTVIFRFGGMSNDETAEKDAAAGNLPLHPVRRRTAESDLF